MARRRRPPQHLFQAQGQAALAALVRQAPLLAFDFDGTLTPIVPRPDEARLHPAVAARLQHLAQRLPVAVVSGRSVPDLRSRLGFTPTHLVGCHGADDGHDPAATQRWTQRLRAWLQHLAACAAELSALGVQVEDKGAAVALHYRQSSEPARAQALLFGLLDTLPPGLRGFGGKCVVNVVPADAPDKADAVLGLLARSGARTALFAGDDVNDEPVFTRAPADWLTVRVGGRDAATRARFVVNDPDEVASLLDRLIAGLQTL